MKMEKVLSPINSVILLLDPVTGMIPDSMGGGLVSSTPSCVAIGTLSAADGTTAIVLSDEEEPVGCDPTMQLVFEGELETPTLKLAVCTVDLQEVLALRVDRTQTVVQVWVNDPSEPDQICVYAGKYM